jgi:hypothetical protein
MLNETGYTGRAIVEPDEDDLLVLNLPSRGSAAKAVGRGEQEPAATPSRKAVETR